MVSQPRQPGVRLVGVLVWLLAAACSAQQTPTQQPEPVRIPNPAVRKCLEDGYEVEALRGADGVPVDHVCVDTTTGKRCKAWDYFRGDCRLRDAPRR